MAQAGSGGLAIRRRGPRAPMTRRLIVFVGLLVGCAPEPDAVPERPRALSEAVASAEGAAYDVYPSRPSDTDPDSTASSPSADPRESDEPPETDTAGTPPPVDGRYALLVGIDDYPGDGDDLPSGNLDVDAVRDLLVGVYAFDPAHVLVLRDADATRGAVRRAFADHLGRARQTAVFYFSGHGVRLDDNLARPDDEADGRDEALYLWDDDGRHGALVLDDEVDAWSASLAATHVLAVIDACHSGTAARGVTSGVPPVKEVDEAAITLGASRPVPPAPPHSREVHVLAAADDDELALAGPPGRPSLFTDALTRTLRNAGPRATLRDEMATVARLVHRVSRGYGVPHLPQADVPTGLRVADLLGPAAATKTARSSAPVFAHPHVP